MTILEDFNALSLGTLNGQNSWSGNPAPNYQVQSDVVQEGTKALQSSGTAYEIHKDIPANPSGIMGVWMRTTGSSDPQVHFREGSAGKFSVTYRADLGCIRLNSDNSYPIACGLSFDTWYFVEVEFDQTRGTGGQMRGRVDGGTWTDWHEPYLSGWTTIDHMWIAMDSYGGTSYIDNITYSPSLVADTQAPTIPTNLVATATSTSQINLSWTASTDNVGVTGYKIFRDGVQITTVVATSYSDTGLTASTAYSYTVSAYDAAGNNSAQTSSVSATTQAVSADPLNGQLMTVLGKTYLLTLQ